MSILGGPVKELRMCCKQPRARLRRHARWKQCRCSAATASGGCALLSRNPGLPRTSSKRVLLATRFYFHRRREEWRMSN